MLSKIEISAADIEAVARDLRIDLSDPEKVAILQAIESCDIQAGPGSGKTTLLTAKLALIAKKWRLTDRGVCVLSHTNVARREIENRLCQSPELRRLLNYPHFIGTFQTFADQFLALPYLRQAGVEVAAIDNDRFAERAWQISRRLKFKAIQTWLWARYKKDAERQKAIVGTLRYTNANLDVESAHLRAGIPGATSKTGAALRDLKHEIRQEGYFRYDDMFAFSEAALHHCPFLTRVIRLRFPWVFLDELQDTSAIQDRLAEGLFGSEHSILQRFGDKNQGIYDFNEDDETMPSLFGRRKTFLLSTTRRFGQQIAKFASGLTAVEPQTLIGNRDKPDRRHTIFVFDRNAIQQVVPRFANLVIQELGREECASSIIKVVGARKNEGNHKKDRFPASIRDYWAGFLSDVATRIPAPDSLIGYIEQGRIEALKSKLGGDAAYYAMGGLVALVQRANPDGVAADIKSRTDLRRWLMENKRWHGVQQLLWTILNPNTPLDANTWTEVTRTLRKSLGELLCKTKTGEISQFLELQEPSGIAGVECNQSSDALPNTYQYGTCDGSISMTFDSIHAVKGETHKATLILETFSQQHDLLALLPVLTGDQTAGNLSPTNVGHCKRIFVAASRPSDLLCVAIFKDHIQEHQMESLRARGWNVERLESSGRA